MPKQVIKQKVSLTTKVHPDLPEQIDDEAKEKELTRSAYIEQILLRRHDVEVDVSALQQRIFALEAENAELSRTAKYPILEQTAVSEADVSQVKALELQVQTIKREKMQLLDAFQKEKSARNTLAQIQSEQLPHWLDKEGYQELITSLRKLQTKFPDKDLQSLLNAALKLVLHNEGSNRILWLSHFYSRKLHLQKSK